MPDIVLGTDIAPFLMELKVERWRVLLNIVEYLEFLKTRKNVPENLKEQYSSLSFTSF